MKARFPGGHQTYRAYLKGRLWKEIRNRVLERDGHECQVCLRPAQCVHHIDYKKRTLEGAQDSSLISLCNDCHHHVEFIGDERIDPNNPSLKAQRLDALLIAKRGRSLAEWQGKAPRKPQPKSKKRKKQKVNRAAMAKELQRRHAEIGAEADRSLRMWRSMPHWQRRNYLVAQ